VDGVAYNYRSASLTASNPLAAGAKSFSITATDTNAHAGTTSGFTTTVDNTAPAGSGVQTANSSGGTVGRAETGDTITYTFTEPIDPITIVAGWDGTGAQTVTVRLIQNGGGDRVQVWNAANGAQLSLGLIRLGGTGYTAASMTFTGSSLTMSGTAITIVLGVPSGAVGTQAMSTTMRWTPSNAARDRAYNQCSTAAINETGAADQEF
jgi:hypothetical protein